VLVAAEQIGAAPNAQVDQRARLAIPRPAGSDLPVVEHPLDQIERFVGRRM
jgi:hypothetical protein